MDGAMKQEPRKELTSNSSMKTADKCKQKGKGYYFKFNVTAPKKKS